MASNKESNLMDGIRAELARWPALDETPKNDDEVLTLTIDFKRGSEEFPILFKLVSQAFQDANASSLRDQLIKEPAAIVITNDNDDNKIGPHMGLYPDGKICVELPKKFFDNNSAGNVLSVLTHEFGHIPQVKELDFLNSIEKQDTQHLLGPASLNVRKRIHELTNDRLVADGVELIDYLLGDVSETPRFYNYSEIEKDHPNVRNRIEALLNEAYADKGLVGEFGADNKFHLKRQDFLPITEDGRKVSNYYTEILPAAEKIISSNLTTLDRLVKGGLSENEKKLYVDHLRHSIADFRQEHPLKFEAPTNAFLAQQFEASLKDPRKVEAVTTMHEKMPQAFKAYDQAVQQSKHFVTTEAQDLIINTARQNIVDGISEGKYPEIKQSQTVPEFISLPIANTAELAQ